MRYIFFGSPEFAAIVLAKMIDNDQAPVAVVCNPDRPVGRKHIITPPAVKQLIIDKGLEEKIKIFQPEKLSPVIDELKALEPDLFVVAAYAKIIPQSVLDIPRLGTVGVHPSLLPHLRGASPIQSALLSGEGVTGVSLYSLGAGVDDGPVYDKRELSIGEEETFGELLPRLAELGGDMLVELLPRLEDGSARAVEQDGSLATFTRKFVTEDGFVPEKEVHEAVAGSPLIAVALHNRIRALASEPGVWTMKDGKRVKIIEANLDNKKLVIRTIQKEGKTPEPCSPGMF